MRIRPLPAVGKRVTMLVGFGVTRRAVVTHRTRWRIRVQEREGACIFYRRDEGILWVRGWTGTVPEAFQAQHALLKD